MKMYVWEYEWVRLCVGVCERVRGDVILFKFQGCLIPILSLPSSASSKMVICYSLPLGGGKLDSERLMQCIYTHFLYHPKWGGTRPIWPKIFRNRGLFSFYFNLFFNWWKIALQFCVGFFHTTMWISHDPGAFSWCPLLSSLVSFLSTALLCILYFKIICPIDSSKMACPFPISYSPALLKLTLERRKEGIF